MMKKTMTWPHWPGWTWPQDRSWTTRLAQMLQVPPHTDLPTWIRTHQDWFRSMMGITNQLTLRGYERVHYIHHEGASSQLIRAYRHRTPYLIKVTHTWQNQHPRIIGYAWLELAIHSSLSQEKYLMGCCDRPLFASLGSWPMSRVGIVLPQAQCNLRQRLQHPITETLVLKWTHMLVEGLARFHRRYHLAHMDIKPENVLVWSDSHLMWCDFGHSVRIADQPEFSAHQQTLWYRAPELLAATQPLIAYSPQATDIWALGMVLWDLLFESPFLSRYPPEQALKRVQNPLSLVHLYHTRPGLSNSFVHSFLQLWIQPLLQLDPTRRRLPYSIPIEPYPTTLSTAEQQWRTDHPSPELSQIAPRISEWAEHIHLKPYESWTRYASELFQRSLYRLPHCTDPSSLAIAACTLSCHILYPWYNSTHVYQLAQPTSPTHIQEWELEIGSTLNFHLLV